MTAVIASSSDQKTHALIAYILMVIGLFTAVPLLVGGVWAMFTRKNSVGSIYHSHYTNAIRVFWWWLFWFIVGGILVFVGVGLLILGLVWLWVLYRVIYGLAKITSDEPYPL